MSGHKKISPAYPIGFQRKDWPELWGWSEMLEASGRKDFSLRYLRTTYPDRWPVPVAVLASGPVYSAEECRAFLTAHEKQRRSPLTDKQIERIYALADAEASVDDIAIIVECSTASVYNHLKKRRNR
jgi:DNA-binding CsgD family transcriptional regulator